MSSVQISLNSSLSQLSNLHRRFTPDRERSSVRINGWRVVTACLNVGVEAQDRAGKVGFGKKSKEVKEAEGKVLVGTYARAPVVLASGKGCKLYDVEGREYLHMSSGIAVNALWHGDEDWLKAVVEQANILTHVSNMYYSIPQVELAKLLAVSSFADRVFFSNTGTEANEAAIKFARKFQRRSNPDRKEPSTEFIAFTNSFHGCGCFDKQRALQITF